MKRLPVTNHDFRPLRDLAMGPLKGTLMQCAIKLQIFDKLNNLTKADDAACLLGIHPENTRRFLDALSTMDLLEKSGGRYRNRPLAREFLVTTSPTYVGGLLTQTLNHGSIPVDIFENRVRKGPDPKAGDTKIDDPSFWQQAVRASAGWVFGGAGQMVAGVVENIPGFQGFKKMLDLGCGHGVFSLYILAQHPDLKGVLLDRPEVLKTAEAFARKFDALDRITVLPADYITGDIGEGYDLVWASSTLNFAVGCLETVIQKIYSALNPGGYFISFQNGLVQEKTKPDIMLGMVPQVLENGVDCFFDQGRIAQAAIACGFQSVRSKTVHTPVGEMELDIAGKERTSINPMYN